MANGTNAVLAGGPPALAEDGGSIRTASRLTVIKGERPQTLTDLIDAHNAGKSIDSCALQRQVVLRTDELIKQLASDTDIPEIEGLDPQDFITHLGRIEMLLAQQAICFDD